MTDHKEEQSASISVANEIIAGLRAQLTNAQKNLVEQEKWWQDQYRPALRAQEKARARAEAAESRCKVLEEKVRAVYYAGHWTCPTLSQGEQIRLWTELRDAAGFEPGNAPKPEARKALGDHQ